MLKWNKIGLRNQFLIFFIVLQLLVLGLLFYYFYHNQNQFYLDQLKETLENESKLIVNNEKVDFSSNPASEIDRWVKKWGQKIETRITIIKRNGQVLADSKSKPDLMDNHGDRPEIRNVLEGDNKDTSIRYSKTLNKKMFYFASPVKKDGKLIGVIRLYKSLKNINKIIKNNIRSYFLFICIILIITFLLLLKFTSNIINPLSKLTEMASNIAHGNFGQRIKLKNYENEIGILARMFNYMADQLEDKIEEISEEKNRAEAILSSMVDGVIATDINRKIILANPAARKMLDINVEHVEQKDLITIIRHFKIDKSLEEALENNETVSEEITIKNPDKKILRCNFAPITDEQNNVIGGIIVFTNITELRKLEQIRKDFVANVSHELRTPLTSIIGYVDTLLENEIKDFETSNRFLNIIKREADRLSLLIKDLLNLSKFEDNQYSLKPDDFEPILNKTLKILKESAAEKNITITTELEPNLPLVLMIPEQIEQVLINLIDNSIKYTPEGGEVIIKAYTKVNKLFIEVEDNGIGIPQKDLDRIFERFYRVDKARSRSLGGTGIGLSIVKHIIKGHNSEIEVKSEEDKGTCFRFYLNKAR